jgi:hypothetical protein
VSTRKLLRPNECSLSIADSGFSVSSNTKTTTFLRPSHAFVQLVLASIDGWSVTLLIYLPFSIFRAEVYPKRLYFLDLMALCTFTSGKSHAFYRVWLNAGYSY